jgi:hypothetical protein
MNHAGLEQTTEGVSCTRSALTVVILSMMGVSLIVPLQMRPHLRELGTYIATRTILAAHVIEIEKDSCLKTERIDKIKVSELIESKCFTRKNKNDALEILNALEVFKGMKAVEKARFVGYSADFPIYRWGLRLNNLVQLSGGKIRDITFEQARELANYEYPDMAEYKDLFYRHEIFSAPWSLISVRLDRAVTLVELGLALTLAYLWLFLQEAISSGVFYRAGTIFSAMSRTSLSRGLFFIFVLVPPLVACNLVIASYYAGPPFTKMPFFEADIYLQTVLAGAFSLSLP